MIKVYKENVVLSISEEQLTEYTKKGFKEVGKKEVTDKEKIAKDSYERDVKNHYHPKNGTYKDIGIHEAGHMVLNEILRKKYNDFDMVAIDWNNNITSKQIVDKAFDKLKISDIIQQKRKIADISIHAEKYNSSETIAEAFADYYTNKNNAQLLSKAIVEVMKGMI